MDRERMGWSELIIRAGAEHGGVKPRHCSPDHSSQKKPKLTGSQQFYRCGRRVLG